MSRDFLYDRQSIRLRGYDYTQNGLYFVTICTHNRENLFGEIKNGKMVLNGVGKIVGYWWNTIPEKFPGIELDIHQIMPNHFHGIVIVGARSLRPIQKPPTLGQMIAYFKYESTKQINNYVGVGFSDPSIINSSDPIKKWQVNHGIFAKIFQRNFYEHIIRNEKEYFAIKCYIKDNPKNWEHDVENIM